MTINLEIYTLMSKRKLVKRENFASKFGIIAAAAGSAVGLGNIWRFPYIAGENGGGAYLLIYILFIILIGLPAMLSELVIGRASKSNAVGAFKKLKSGSTWYLVGVLGIFTGFLIFAFYSTVAGWTLHYTYLAIKGTFSGLSAMQLEQLFQQFHSSSLLPVFWQIIFLLLTAAIVITGIEKGIERYTKILMPLLFIILIFLVVRSLTLPGGNKGLEFLFKPDFSKVSANTFLNAMGQAFFSLSLGMGVLITYGSYIKKNENLSEIAGKVVFFDTLVAILAGVAIFPAVFAFALKPEAGPGLAFITLPGIFEYMPGGYFFGVFFFLLLLVSALTSSISLLEVTVAFLTEEFKISRKVSTIWSSLLVALLGILATLSFGVLSDFHIFKKTIFDFLDNLTANILLPVGGFLIVIFVGWFMDYKQIREELTNQAKYKARLFEVYMFLIRYIVPLAIFIVFLNSIGVINF